MHKRFHRKDAKSGKEKTKLDVRRYAVDYKEGRGKTQIKLDTIPAIVAVLYPPTPWD